MNFPLQDRQRTYLLGHSVEEVAVTALLLPCPHEARLLGARRSGAELHGAACSLSTANNANTTLTTNTTTTAAAAAEAGVSPAAGRDAHTAGGLVNLSRRRRKRRRRRGRPGRLRVSAGLCWDWVALAASHIQLCLLGLGQKEGEREDRRKGGREECEGGEKKNKSAKVGSFGVVLSLRFFFSSF